MYRTLKTASSTALLTLALGLALGARADDTDIYLTPKIPTGSEPLVMFMLDWRPNLASNFPCPDDGSGCDRLRDAGYIGGAQGTSVTYFDILRGVFKQVLDPLEGVQIGFMMNHANTNVCVGPPPVARCSQGAYVLSGFKSMKAGTDDPAVFDTLGEDPNKLALWAKLDGIPLPQGNSSHTYQGKELYFEYFRYLTGQGVYNGHNGMVDFGDSPGDAVNLDQETLFEKGAKASWDTTIEEQVGVGANAVTEYVSPLLNATECTKLFAVNILFQVSQQEDNSDTAILASKANGGMAGIDLSGTKNSFPTVIRYLKDVDLGDGTFGDVPDIDGKQNVVSFFIADPQSLSGTTVPEYAVAGGSGSPIGLSNNTDELVDTLNSILRSILSVSTTFVAPSVPVNVFNRAQTLNEVFLALFDADEQALPRWPGNLKKLVIDENPITGDLELQDVNGVGAIDIDGRIKRDALTYFTDAASLLPPVDDEVAGADGRSVARGGVGQRIPGYILARNGTQDLALANTGPNARKLFYDDSADVSDGLSPLNADAATTALLWTELTAKWAPAPSSATYAGATAAEQQRAELELRFARGLLAVDFADTTTLRDWLLGDPLHSRPSPINYGARGSYTMDNPDIRVLMGTNDGLMHMFRNTTAGGAQSGVEDWALMPREAMPLLDRLRQNTGGTPTHPVSVDGSPAVRIRDLNFDGTVNGADKVYAAFGLRRGGKCYYGLDLTDPDAPRFMWKRCKGDVGFSELAQTWSEPFFGRVAISDTNSDGVINVLDAIDVIIFGGGYNGDDDGDNLGDLGKDAANRLGLTGTDDDEGNAVFIVNAVTGELIWKATGGASTGFSSADKAYRHEDMVDSIPSDVAAADTDGDQLTDRIYVGDTGGVLWRFDIEGDNIANWTATPVMNVGRHFSGDPENDRRFFNRPDIVQTRDETGNFDGILIGSGDREDPLETTVENYFYLFKDRNIDSGNPPVSVVNQEDFADLTVDCISAENCDGTTLTKLSDTGWTFALGSSGSGDKNLAPAITLGGAVFFTTFAPGDPASSCDLSEGTGKVFAIDIQAATPLFNYDTTNDAGGETLERADTLASGGIPVEVVPLGDDLVLIQGQEAGANIQQTGTTTSWDTFWYDEDQ